jgi:hypothetical protein
MRKLALILIASAGCLLSHAQAQTYRFYDQYGSQTGSARPNWNGGYNFYNQYGGQTGSARPNWNAGYNFYDQYGNQTGSQRRGW